jgi:hypothetical protein
MIKYLFKNEKNGEVYEIALLYVEKKLQGFEFNFPQNRDAKKILARIFEFTDFESIEKTTELLATIGFKYLQPQSKKEVRENYTKLFCDLWKVFYNTTYKVPKKEAAMLHTVLSCSDTEATKLFNLFFVCQEYWAKPKTIAVFAKCVNEVRRLMNMQPQISLVSKAVLPTNKPINKYVDYVIKENDVITVEAFQEIVRKFNTNNPAPMLSQDFANKYGYVVYPDKVIYKPKKL